MRALERLLLDDELRRIWAECGADRARAHFSLVRLIEDIDALYRRLASESSQADAQPLDGIATGPVI